MYTFKAKFPDRKNPALPNETYVTATDARTAWDKVHRDNPHDRIEIEAVDVSKGGTCRRG